MNRLAIVAIVVSALLLQACSTAVSTGARVAHDRRSAGIMLDDHSIMFKVSHRLSVENGFSTDDAHINVNVYNLQVLLTGEVRSDALRAQAEERARSVPLVREVQNHLLVAEPTSTSSRLNDTWITTKAKSALFNIDLPDFDPLRVQITTERGEVFLMGLVTADEARAVIDKVRHIRGVTKVMDMLEYVQP